MYENYLAHYGVKGMKWGVRRYENKDGTLTEAGRRRRARLLYRDTKKLNNILKKASHDGNYKKMSSAENAYKQKLREEYRLKSTRQQHNALKSKIDALERDEDAIWYEYADNTNKHPSFKAYVKNTPDFRNDSSFYTTEYLSSPKYSRGDKTAERYRTMEQQRHMLEKELKRVNTESAKDILGRYADKQFVDVRNVGQYSGPAWKRLDQYLKYL